MPDATTLVTFKLQQHYYKDAAEKPACGFYCFHSFSTLTPMIERQKGHLAYKINPKVILKGILRQNGVDKV